LRRIEAVVIGVEFVVMKRPKMERELPGEWKGADETKMVKGASFLRAWRVSSVRGVYL
jgi:hypothetical protein